MPHKLRKDFFFLSESDTDKSDHMDQSQEEKKSNGNSINDSVLILPKSKTENNHVEAEEPLFLAKLFSKDEKKTATKTENDFTPVDSAEDWYQNVEYSLNNGFLHISSVKPGVTDLKIMSTAVIDGKTYQTKIYCSAFDGNTDLVNLSFEKGVQLADPTATHWLFRGCTNLTTLDLSGLDTKNVTDMEMMFENCSSLQSLDLSGLDTGNVTDMYETFYGCSNLQSLDLSGWDMSKAHLGRVCAVCSSLTSLYLSRIITSKTLGAGMGLKYTGVQYVNLDNAYLFSLDGLFEDCNSLTRVDMREAIAADSTLGLFSDKGSSSVTSVDMSRADFSQLTSMSGMFYGCSNLVSVELSGGDASNVTGMGNMFSGCSSLTSIDMSGMQAGNVTSMYEMFDNCSSLLRVDLSGIGSDTNKKTYPPEFRNCSKIYELNMSGMSLSSISWLHDSVSLRILNLTDAEVGQEYDHYITIPAISTLEYLSCPNVEWLRIKASSSLRYIWISESVQNIWIDRIEPTGSGDAIEAVGDTYPGVIYCKVGSPAYQWALEHSYDWQIRDYTTIFSDKKALADMSKTLIVEDVNENRIKGAQVYSTYLGADDFLGYTNDAGQFDVEAGLIEKGIKAKETNVTFAVIGPAGYESAYDVYVDAECPLHFVTLRRQVAPGDLYYVYAKRKVLDGNLKVVAEYQTNLLERAMVADASENEEISFTISGNQISGVYFYQILNKKESQLGTATKDKTGIWTIAGIKSRELSPGATYQIRTTTGSNKPKIQKIQDFSVLKSEESEETLDFGPGFTKEIEIPISDSEGKIKYFKIPLKAKKVAATFQKLTGIMVAGRDDKDNVYFGIGVDPKKVPGIKSFDGFQQAFNNEKSGYTKDYKSVFKRSSGMDFKVFGYAQANKGALEKFEKKKVNSLEVKGRIKVDFGFTYEKEWQFQAGYVPMTTEFRFTATIGSDSSMTMVLERIGKQYKITGPTSETLIVKGTVGLEVSAGVGVATIANAGIYGKLTGDISYRLAPENLQGLKDLGIKGEIGVYGEFIGFKKDLPLISMKKDFYKDGISQTGDFPDAVGADPVPEEGTLFEELADRDDLESVGTWGG